MLRRPVEVATHTTHSRRSLLFLVAVQPPGLRALAYVAFIKLMSDSNLVL